MEVDEVVGKLSALRKRRQPWRGEATLADASGAPRPLLVRADPVISGPDRVLGFVLLFTDLADQKRAEADAAAISGRNPASPWSRGLEAGFPRGPRIPLGR